MQQMDITNNGLKLLLLGYGKQELISPFEIAGPLTEVLLIVNLAIRGHDIQKEVSGEIGYSVRSVKLLWDNDNMQIINFDDVNQFLKRDHREGCKNLVLEKKTVKF